VWIGKHSQHLDGRHREEDDPQGGLAGRTDTACDVARQDTVRNDTVVNDLGKLGGTNSATNGISSSWWLGGRARTAGDHHATTDLNAALTRLSIHLPTRIRHRQ
jgi:hypothetical protein